MDLPKKTKLCSNCKREISKDSYLTHELHCERKIVMCKVCDEPIPRTEIEEHNQTEHGPVPCDLCGTTVPQHDLDKHKEVDCPKVEILCKYCELDVARGEFEEHTGACGSRTDVCELCNQRVMIRYMQEHLKNKCNMPARANDMRNPFAMGQGQMNNQELDASTIPELLPTYNSNHLNGRPLPVDPPSPPPSYDMHQQVGVQVDPQWLASVSGVCGSDDIDQVLAQNFRAMEGQGSGSGSVYRRRRLISSSSSEDESENNGDRYGGVHGLVSHFHNHPRSLSREELEKADIERKDTEFAMRIHEQENAYKPARAGSERHEEMTSSYESAASTSALPTHGHDRRINPFTADISEPRVYRPLKREDSGGLSTEESDAEMARKIYERDLHYSKKNAGPVDPGHLHWVDPSRPQNNVKEVRGSPDNGFPGGTLSDTSGRVDMDNEVRLAREGARSDRTTSPYSPTRADRWNTDNDARFARELEQKEREYINRLDVDRKLAEQIQQSEDRNRRLENDRDARMEGNSETGEKTRFEVTEEDRRVGERMQVSERPRYGRGGDDLEVARRLLVEKDSSERSHRPQASCNHEILMNEDPRPKTPVPQEETTEDEGKVPCQYCSELFPFRLIMDHQKVCLADGPSERNKMSAEFFSSIGQSREQEDVMLTDETLQQISHEDRPGFYDHWGSQMRTCKYCSEAMMLGRLQTHEVVCNKNPDALLRNVHYQPSEPSRRPPSPRPPSPRSPSPDLRHKAADQGDVNPNSCGPCEYCRELIPVANLVKHEISCHLRAGSIPHTGTSNSSRAKHGLAIRFPGQDMPTSNPSHPSSSLSSSTDPMQGSSVRSLPSKRSSDFHTRTDSPLKAKESRTDRARLHKKEEEVIHSTKQRSEPSLTVIGKSIGTRPDFPGSSARSKRTEEEESIRGSLHQPPLAGRGNRYGGPPIIGGGADPVKKPLDLNSSGLGRKPLHSDSGRHSFI